MRYFQNSLSVSAAILAAVSFLLTRLILLVFTGLADIPLPLWPNVLSRGTFFDIATLAYLLSPFLLLDAGFPQKLNSHRWFKAYRHGILAAVFFGFFFLSVAEITFWMEFHTRMNFIALDYLIYTNEVIRNIWQSYPIVWIVSILCILSWVVTRFLQRRWLENPPVFSNTHRGALVLVAIVLPLASYRWIRVEIMYRQGNALAEEISGNGLFTLAAAARHNELDYDRFYATIPQAAADKILRELGVEWTGEFRLRGTLETREMHAPLASFLIRRPKNIVLVSVESLSASYVGVYGSQDSFTPLLDVLSKECLLFRNVYATGTRTVRGLEALALATPPIPGQAIIRRPHNSHLTSMGQMLRYQGYEPFFFYGGYGYFDNMNVFFAANGYTVLDRPSIPQEKIIFENAWGVADEVLYDHALETLGRVSPARKPFFAHVMTTSNHRPYTYPPNRIDIPSPGGRKGAVKYSDYALNKFIADAKGKPWFKDTLFVIVADHCASVAGRTALPISDYRIPLLLYGPGIVKPGTIDRMISQIDIAPTLFDILGVGGDDNFFGLELTEQKGPPRAFISNYQNLGYYKNDQLIVLKPKSQIEAYHVDPKTFESVLIRADPRLVDEAIAHYQTASRAFKEGKLELLWK